MRLIASAAGVLTILAGVIVNAQSDSRIYALIPGSSGISHPQVVKHVQPRYSRKARAARVDGVMTVDVTIRSNGRASDVMIRESELRSARGTGTLTSGEIADLGLDKAAISAVRQWRWRPATKNGIPVAVRLSVPVTFRP